MTMIPRAKVPVKDGMSQSVSFAVSSLLPSRNLLWTIVESKIWLKIPTIITIRWKKLQNMLQMKIAGPF